MLGITQCFCLNNIDEIDQINVKDNFLISVSAYILI